MVRQPTQSLTALYEADEVAWLEAMSELAALGHGDALDLANLAEYLHTMARREYRELNSRLALLIMHILKWTYQPEKRSGSWRSTIRTQRSELLDIFESKTMKNFAINNLGASYAMAVENAADETGLPPEDFPAANPFTLDQWLSPDLVAS